MKVSKKAAKTISKTEMRINQLAKPVKLFKGFIVKGVFNGLLSKVQNQKQDFFKNCFISNQKQTNYCLLHSKKLQRNTNNSH